MSKKTTISIQIDTVVLSRIDKIAAERELSRSYIIRMMIKSKLAEVKE